MGFFGDAKGIHGSSELKQLDRAIQESFGSTGIFGDSYAADRLAFVKATFDTFLNSKNYSHGEATSWGEKTIEPHEVEEVLAILSAGGARYHITQEQIDSFRKRITNATNS